MRKKRLVNSAFGFTLIELLIVITVIVLLAKIMLANITSAEDKTRMATLLRFETSVDRALGPALVGEWSFDKLQTNQTTDLDTSTRGNDLTICPTSGATCAVGQDCYPPANSGLCAQGIGMGQCFDTSNLASGGTYTAPYTQYWLSRPYSSLLGMNSTQGKTVSLWIKTQPFTYVTPSAPGLQVLLQQRDEYAIGLLYVSGTGYRVRMYFHSTSSGIDTYTIMAFPAVPVKVDDQWHHIVAVWDNPHQKYAVFIDGKKSPVTVNASYAPTPAADAGNFSIGRGDISYANGPAPAICTEVSTYEYWTGLIDRVRVYNDALDI